MNIPVRNYAAWAEAFTIFAKYDPDEYGNVNAEHDIIYAGCDPEIVSEEDKARLEELGFHIDGRLNSFYHFT